MSMSPIIPITGTPIPLGPPAPPEPIDWWQDFSMLTEFAKIAPGPVRSFVQTFGMPRNWEIVAWGGGGLLILILMLRKK